MTSQHLLIMVVFLIFFLGETHEPSLQTEPFESNQDLLSRSRLACRHCGEVIVEERLVQAIQELEKNLGRSVVITSGYRCPEHNRLVGGSRHSLHMSGLAVDLHVPGLSVRDLRTAVLKVRAFQDGGIGTYPTFIHADLRDSPARW